MVKLNLEAKDKSQERIKAYLESNVSEILADKINNGTPFEKDGKQLINRKDLDGFMDYANSDQIADSLQQAIEQKQRPVEPAPQQPVEQKPKNPLYEKYKTYTDRYPDSVIAMRFGDFYEVFGKKATLIADKANLTLTGRDMSGQRIPMVGFPFHAAEAYFKKIRQSYSLVIVDGDEVRKLDEFGIEDIIDGDNELTDDEERLIDDDLTVEEMAQFDGDIQEPTGIPERVLTDEQKQSMKYVLTKDDIVSDPSVLKRLHEILGDVLA